MTLAAIGAAVLGLVIGYLTHYLVRRDQQAGVGDLAMIIGAILGAAIFNIIKEPEATYWYLIGLGIGFFLYWLALLLGREKVKKLIEQKKALPVLPFLE
jgi:uncharacterized membrane protein YeaQ/YmgE (transglycosylase-associated protein family)